MEAKWWKGPFPGSMSDILPDKNDRRVIRTTEAGSLMGMRIAGVLLSRAF